MNNLNILTPTAGHFLTQADDSTAIEARLITTSVILAVNDAESNWKEITKEEADAIQAEQLKFVEQSAMS